eukprot:2801014-Prymnesium_polylepis.1
MLGIITAAAASYMSPDAPDALAPAMNVRSAALCISCACARARPRREERRRESGGFCAATRATRRCAWG